MHATMTADGGGSYANPTQRELLTTIASANASQLQRSEDNWRDTAIKARAIADLIKGRLNALCGAAGWTGGGADAFQRVVANDLLKQLEEYATEATKIADELKPVNDAMASANTKAIYNDVPWDTDTRWRVDQKKVDQTFWGKVDEFFTGDDDAWIKAQSEAPYIVKNGREAALKEVAKPKWEGLLAANPLGPVPEIYSATQTPVAPQTHQFDRLMEALALNTAQKGEVRLAADSVARELSTFAPPAASTPDALSGQYGTQRVGVENWSGATTGGVAGAIAGGAARVVGAAGASAGSMAGIAGAAGSIGSAGSVGSIGAAGSIGSANVDGAMSGIGSTGVGPVGSTGGLSGWGGSDGQLSGHESGPNSGAGTGGHGGPGGFDVGGPHAGITAGGLGGASDASGWTANSDPSDIASQPQFDPDAAELQPGGTIDDLGLISGTHAAGAIGAGPTLGGVGTAGVPSGLAGSVPNGFAGGVPGGQAGVLAPVGATGGGAYAMAPGMPRTMPVGMAPGGLGTPGAPVMPVLASNSANAGRISPNTTLGGAGRYSANAGGVGHVGPASTISGRGPAGGIGGPTVGSTSVGGSGVGGSGVGGTKVGAAPVGNGLGVGPNGKAGASFQLGPTGKGIVNPGLTGPVAGSANGGTGMPLGGVPMGGRGGQKKDEGTTADLSTWLEEDEDVWTDSDVHAR